MKKLTELCLSLAFVSLVACSSDPEAAQGGEPPAAVQAAAPSEPTDPCAQDPACTQDGRCETQPEGTLCRGRVCEPTDTDCIARSDRDCRASSRCEHSGECTSWNSLSTRHLGTESTDPLACLQGAACCVVSDDDCKNSDNCTAFARCSARDSIDGELVRRSCVIASDADCALSDWCKNLGDCSFIPGDPPRCGKVQPQWTAEACTNSPGCKISGICGFEDGKCVVNDEGCRASSACGDSGACTAVESASQDLSCQAVTDKDCAGSLRCEESGACHIKTEFGRSNCAPKSQADCEGSSRCQTEQMCTFRGGLCILNSATGF